MKGKKLYSIFKMKCPYCHEGDFFKAGPYNIKKAGNLHDNCSKCGGKYSLEPGFYQGALYVSYGLSVATFVSCLVAVRVLSPEATYGTYIWVNAITIVILSPWLFAMSKIIWANMFIKYVGPSKSKL
jgi:uncharacterized protein (DUF983 family)